MPPQAPLNGGHNEQRVALYNTIIYIITTQVNRRDDYSEHSFGEA